jgi:hypothetical protein
MPEVNPAGKHKEPCDAMLQSCVTAAHAQLPCNLLDELLLGQQAFILGSCKGSFLVEKLHKWLPNVVISHL